MKAIMNRLKVQFLFGVILILVSYAETSVVTSGCTASDSSNSVTLNGEFTVTANVKVWIAVILILSIGVFGLFFSLVHRIIRSYIYYDAHLVDTFFDAGGDTNFALISTTIVSKITWISMLIIPLKHIMEVGIVGHFWFAAGISVPVLLFSIVVAEIRVKAPGAKTYLQVLHARYGPVTQSIMMVFALIVNALVIGIVLMDGSRLISSLTDGLGIIETVLLLILATLFYTLIGGVGGGMYMAYSSSVFIMGVTMLCLSDILFNLSDRADNAYGNMTALYGKLDCILIESNEQMSGLTFISHQGLINGVVIFLSTFAHIFVNQSYWQLGVAAKPLNGVWGYLFGGLCTFAVPFCFSYGLGIVYWAMVVDSGTEHLVSQTDEAFKGEVLLIIMQKLFKGTDGRDGSFIILALIATATITTLNSEILSAASIFVYDVYQTLVAPFRTKNVDSKTDVHAKRMQRNEEYLEYNKRSGYFKTVAIIGLCCAAIPISMVLHETGTSSWYLYCVGGVLANCAVAPIVLSIIWHRITWHGVIWGVVTGLITSILLWLVIPVSMESSVTLRQFALYTSEDDAIIAATAGGLVISGLFCLILSLSCGGCDRDVQEDEEWEKTRDVDNVILPWSVKYAPEIKGAGLTKGRPHFFTVRRVFKCSEVSAYILGVFLAVSILLIWPALMLLIDKFTLTMFVDWSWAVVIVGIIVTIFLSLFPLILELTQICSQAFYNRQWYNTENRQRLEEENSESGEKPTLPMPTKKSEPIDTDSDIQSTFGRQNSLFDGDSKERWKTFIHLD